MSEREQFEGKTLSDAIERASMKFNATRDRIEYRIIKESQGGFFGLLGGKIIIEAWVRGPISEDEIEEKYGIDLPEKKPAQPARPEGDRHPRGSRDAGGRPPAPDGDRGNPQVSGTPRGDGQGPGAPHADGEGKKRRRRRGRRGKGGPGQDRPPQEPRDPTAADGTNPNGKAGAPSGPGKRPYPQPVPPSEGRRDPAAADGTKVLPSGRRDPAAADGTKVLPSGRRDPADQRPIAVEPVTVGPEVEVFLKGLFVHLGEELTFALEEDSQHLLVKITVGPDSIFSSREGHTIESLKFLLDKTVNKGPVIRKRVKVHVSELSTPDQDEWTALGAELGKKALAMNRPVAVRGLQPQDRKAIHTALLGVQGVETMSSGDGVFRRIFIVPKGARPAPKKPAPDELATLGEDGESPDDNIGNR